MRDKKSITRKLIIEAAFFCFNEYGYAKTTFDDIAQKAGISRASVYNYFKSKEDFFYAIVEGRHNNYTQQSREILDSDIPKKEKIKRIIYIWIVDPHRLIDKTTLPHALFKDIAGLRKSEALLKEKFIGSLSPLLGYDLAEVIVLSYRGILDDKPSVETLEKRTDTLVNALIIPPDKNNR
jgi:AcrR family transcriptional regulator